MGVLGRVLPAHQPSHPGPSRTVGQLATGYTMEQDFYTGRLRDLPDRGAEGILLGCREIDLLVGPADSPVPVFDTTRLHAERAVELALSASLANA
jgi:aspartate/glutamate racemase